MRRVSLIVTAALLVAALPCAAQVRVGIVNSPCPNGVCGTPAEKAQAVASAREKAAAAAVAVTPPAIFHPFGSPSVGLCDGPDGPVAVESRLSFLDRGPVRRAAKGVIRALRPQ